MDCKRVVYFSGLVLLVGAINAFAQITISQWDNGGEGQLWSVPENWKPDEVPGANSAVVIDIADANCVIDDSITAACAALTIGYTPFIGNCYFDVTGGSLAIGGRIDIAGPADSNGVFTMTGGTVTTSGSGRLWIGGNNGNGTFIMRGGHMSIADKLEIGKNAPAQGWMYMDGGTLEIADDFEIAKYGSATVVMNGGLIDVADRLKLGESNGTAKLYLNGGILQIDSNDIGFSGNSIFDISGGQLNIAEDINDAKGPIEDRIANGFITAYGGVGNIEIVFDANQELTIVQAARPDPEFAWAPVPRDNAKVEWQDQGITLTWRPGQYATQHSVYFGTDALAVAEADDSGAWPEFKGLQDANSLDTGPLELGQTYYWRVDEINSEVEGSPWKGQVWTFNVSEYLVVDNFESYTNDANTLSCIYQTWIDGYGYTKPDPGKPANGTGGQAGHDIFTWGSPYYGGLLMETSIVNLGSSQSAPIYYTNDGTFDGDFDGSPDNVFYSEVVRSFDNPRERDWTREGAKSLSLWFYGDPDNDANATEQMYVKVNGKRIDYNGHLIHLTEARWHEWNIDLADFADLGVDLTNVTSMSIGFGSPTNTSGGTGVVYFDDIRLYRPRCMPLLRKPAGDLDGDCDVDYDDVTILAEDWLTTDSVGVGLDGVLHNFPAGFQYYGNLYCDGVDDWVDINDGDMSNFHDKTIAIWVQILNYPDVYPYIFCFQNADADPYRIYIRTRGTDSVRARLVEDYVGEFVTGSDWHHVAFVLRDTPDGWCTGEFYGDGELVGQLPGQPRHSGGAKGVNLGSFSDGSKEFLKAMYDDVRIYDAALSADDIKLLANKGEPTGDMLIHYSFDQGTSTIEKNLSTYVFDRPILSAAELYSGEAEGSRAVNFKDFSLVAQTWLDVQLWP